MPPDSWARRLLPANPSDAWTDPVSAAEFGKLLAGLDSTAPLKAPRQTAQPPLAPKPYETVGPPLPSPEAHLGADPRGDVPSALRGEAPVPPSRQPSMRAPTWSERLNDTARDVTHAIAQFPPVQVLEKLGLTNLGDDRPYTDPNAAYDVKMGDPGLPEGNLARSILPQAEEAATGIRAYHGSGADFDKFDINKIGTGQGANSYGRGLYFAQAEPVALDMRNQLAPKPPVIVGDQSFHPELATVDDILSGHRDADEIVRSRIATKVRNQRAIGRPLPVQTALDHIEAELEQGIHLAVERGDEKLFNSLSNQRLSLARMREAGIDVPQTGHMYEVNLKVDPSELLDWDKRLGQQSPQVQDAVLPHLRALADHTRGAREELLQRGTDSFGRPLRPERLARLQQLAAPLEQRSGADVYRLMGFHPGDAPLDEEAGYLRSSEALKERGIPGAQYLDQHSRTLPAPEDIQAELDAARARLEGRVAEGRAVPLHWQEEIPILERRLRAAQKKPPTRNYVMYDDSLIDILRKYGAVPPLAGLLGRGADQSPPQSSDAPGAVTPPQEPAHRPGFLENMRAQRDRELARAAEHPQANQYARSLLMAPLEGAKQAWRGAGSLLQQPTGDIQLDRHDPETPISGRTTARAASDIIGGGFQASTPLLPAALARAPLKVGAGLIGGTLTAEAVHAAGEKLGIPAEYVDLASHFLGLAGGGAIAHAVEAPQLEASILSKAQELFDATRGAGSETGAVRIRAGGRLGGSVGEPPPEPPAKTGTALDPSIPAHESTEALSKVVRAYPDIAQALLNERSPTAFEDFHKGLGQISRGMVPNDDPAGPRYRLAPSMRARLAHFFLKGQGSPFQADWSPFTSERMLPAFGNDPEVAKQYGTFWGAHSQGTGVGQNTGEASSAWQFFLDHGRLPSYEEALQTAPQDNVLSKIGLPSVKLENVQRALEGEGLSGPKIKDMEAYTQGRKASPLDRHLIYIMGGDTETMDGQYATLRKLVGDTENIKLLADNKKLMDSPWGKVSGNEYAYRRVAEALQYELEHLAPEQEHNPIFGTTWEGGRLGKNLPAYGGPGDIFARKGLLAPDAMLNPETGGALEQALRGKGGPWTQRIVLALLAGVAPSLLPAQGSEAEPDARAPRGPSASAPAPRASSPRR